MKTFALPLLICTCLYGTLIAQTPSISKAVDCHKTRQRDEKRLCRAIGGPDYRETYAGVSFTMATVDVDLNNDRRKETLAWESSWAGSSGGGLWIYSRSGSRLKRLAEIEMTWSPIILMRSKHHGWLDIAFYQTGGGLTETFVVVKHNGKNYTASGTIVKEPKGRMLIRRDWNRSVFGPVK